MIKENELKNGRPKGTVKAVWQKREWQIKKKKKKSLQPTLNPLKVKKLKFQFLVSKLFIIYYQSP
jgi:hypothetical protein